jgi:hypothetical protein
MSLTVPDWLTRHDGNLKVGSDGKTWYVWLAGKPQYSIVPRPVGAAFGCYITQTNNGQPIATTATAAAAEGALKGSLEDLRKVLGW